MKTNKKKPDNPETHNKTVNSGEDKLAASVQATRDQLEKDVKRGDSKAKEFQKLLNAFRK